VIFVSTTLSRPESLPPPQPAAANQQSVESLSVGFWQSPKRFNVAITRAKALLVVVGSPTVLSREPYWRQLLRYAAARGAYRGAGLREMQRLLRVPERAAGGEGAGGADDGGGGAGAEAAAASLLPDEIDEWGAGGGGSRAGAAVGDAGSPEAELSPQDAQEMAAAAAQIAELAYLGLGDADRIFYETLEEFYEATSVSGIGFGGRRERLVDCWGCTLLFAPAILLLVSHRPF